MLVQQLAREQVGAAIEERSLRRDRPSRSGRRPGLAVVFRTFPLMSSRRARYSAASKGNSLAIEAEAESRVVGRLAVQPVMADG